MLKRNNGAINHILFITAKARLHRKIWGEPEIQLRISTSDVCGLLKSAVVFKLQDEQASRTPARKMMAAKNMRTQASEVQ